MQNARRYYSPTSSSNRQNEEEKRTPIAVVFSSSPLSSCCSCCSTILRRIPQDEIWTYREEDENDDEHTKNVSLIFMFSMCSHKVLINRCSFNMFSMCSHVCPQSYDHQSVFFLICSQNLLTNKISAKIQYFPSHNFVI
jgi:hypothetical protein